MAGSGQRWINEVWYGKRVVATLLLTPLSWVYAAGVALRRWLFRVGVLRSIEIDIPVVVVGNLTAGGTGKTPITLWLVRELTARHFKVGIVSRGYGGSGGDGPLAVSANSDPALVGDEPVLLATRSDCPVIVDTDRVAAAQALVEQGIDVVVADDGLQHYRLARQFEIAVVDGSRGFGNERLLPAGPLRESPSRLQTVDSILLNVSAGSDYELDRQVSKPVQRFRLSAQHAHSLTGEQQQALSTFKGQRVHGVAAIGHPARFFTLLESFEIDVVPHPLPDHAPLAAADLRFDDELPVFITEKDAVKCRGNDLDNVWYVPVSAEVDNAGWLDDLETLLRNPAC